MQENNPTASSVEEDLRPRSVEEIDRLSRHSSRGGLKICGSIWRVASDDLVVPAWVEFFMRLIGLSILVGVFVYEEITPDSCAADLNLNIYLIIALVIFTATLINLFMIAQESAKGSIWDRNPNIRIRVTPLVHVNIILIIAECFWALVGSIWVIQGLSNSCFKPDKTLEITDVPLYAICAVIVSTWIGLAIKLFFSCCTYSMMACCTGHTKMNRTNQEHFVGEGSQTCCSLKMWTMCLKDSHIRLFKDVAIVLAEVFDDDNFVPTDIASALLLIYVKQTQRHEMVTYESGRLSSGVTGTPIEFPPTASSENPVSWDDFRMVRRYVAYASSAYGYTWFLMNADPCLNLFKLSPHLTCCATCCSCKQDPDLIAADNCLHCNTAAIRTLLPYLEYDDLVHISFRNNLLEVPFFVALDHEYKKVVVSIRGTLSLEDTLMDLCATPFDLGSVTEGLDGILAHGGMVRAAEYVFVQLRDKNILNKALSYYDDYGIVVTGHSLGAGTAAILAFMLKRYHPSTVCYAYSPPGGLFNEKGSEISKEFTISVIVGKDLVPRLSLHSLNHLKERMKQELILCTLPKYKIIGTGLFAFCLREWKMQLYESQNGGNGMPDQDNVEDVEVIVDNGQSSEPNLAEPILSQRDRVPNYGNSDCQEAVNHWKNVKMYLPGKIWHFERKPGETYKFVLSEKSVSDFQEILVSPKMLTDHFTSLVYSVLTFFDENMENCD